jgi:hypothetical protein
MSFEVWERRYRPIDAKKLGDGTQGDHIVSYDIAKNYHPEKVWTIVDCDGNQYLTPGFRIVNRVGYVVCEVEHGWTERDAVYWRR